MENSAERIASPYTCETFAPYVGDTFSLTLRDGSPAEMVLISAEPLPLKPFDGRALGKSGFVRTDPFALMFRWIGEEMFRQGVYSFRHPRMGEFHMAVVPVGPGETGWMYEAIFN